MSFRDNEVLGNYNFCWGIAKNLKMMWCKSPVVLGKYTLTH
jgi:hypothetical protein